MPRFTPFTRLRPTKTASGGGSYSEVFGSPVTVYGSMNIHDKEVRMTFRVDEDVKIEDVIQVAEDS